MPVRIKLMGLCSFLPDSDVNPGRVTVLMPDATGIATKGMPFLIDNKKGRKHFPILKFNARCLEGSGVLPEDLDIYTPLFETDIELEYPASSPPISPLSSPPAWPMHLSILGQERPKHFKLGLNQAGGNQDHFGWGVEMSRVLGDVLGRIKKTTLDRNPNANLRGEDHFTARLSARIVLDRGLLVSGDPIPADDLLWTVPSLGSGQAYSFEPLSLSAEVILNDISAINLNLRQFDDSRNVTKLRFSSADEIVLEIGNLCSDCLFSTEKEQGNIGDIDRDFLWHYQLCQFRGEIAKAINEESLEGEGEEELVMPEKILAPQIAVVVGEIGGRQVQCMRATFRAL